MYAPAGTYRICTNCKGVFLALDYSERKCADCHSAPQKTGVSVHGF
jgi:hypothetical protein